MGCVSSTFLEDDEARIVRPSTLGHHIVSLTSTTYGILTTLDQPPSHIPPPTLSSSSPSQQQPSEIINSWELMAGLDPITPIKPLDLFEKKCCPPGGEDALVLYTTTLHGIRKTFEDCNAVRSLIQGLGVFVKERDISMDLGFREELKELMKGVKLQGGDGTTVPQVFVKGRYIGGVEAVMRIHEEGRLFGLLEGLPKAEVGGVCDGCGGSRFLPCFRCNGSRKVVVGGRVIKGGGGGGGGGGGEKGKVVRCSECNENGLVLCPICC